MPTRAAILALGAFLSLAVSERLDHRQDAVSWAEYLTRPDFWEKTLQNRQSEFLAVGSMAILAVYSASAARRSRSPSELRTTPRASRGNDRRRPVPLSW